jgi:hypothetical protein
MEYKFFEERIGKTFDVIEGELVESPSGLFTVSTVYSKNSIYLNTMTKSVVLIPETGSYIGQPYKLRTSDCTTLWTRWLDAEFGTEYADVYKNLSHRDFLAWLKGGMCLYFESQPFKRISDGNLQKGDCLVYSFNNRIDSHVAIYLGNERILHHLPKKLSSEDTLDRSKIIGAYRYVETKV